MKKFLIIGTNVAANTKLVFGLIMKNIISIGYAYNKALTFDLQSGNKEIAVGWYTSLPVQFRGMIELTKTYNPEEYPKYDNYDAIEVSKTKNIPMDYTGLMGVPITFLNKYNTEQFQIVGLFLDCSKNDGIFIKGTPVSIDSQHSKWAGPVLNGKAKYTRLIIKNKHPVPTENTVNK